jgi:hypothetical protein
VGKGQSSYLPLLDVSLAEKSKSIKMRLQVEYSLLEAVGTRNISVFGTLNICIRNEISWA